MHPQGTRGRKSASIQFVYSQGSQIGAQLHSIRLLLAGEFFRGNKICLRLDQPMIVGGGAWRRGRQLSDIAQRHARADPVQEQLLFLGAQRPPIDKVANIITGIPGRHALILNHFANRVGPSHGIVIAEERKGTDLPRPMALLTMFLQNRGNVFAEGHLTLSRRRALRRSAR